MLRSVDTAIATAGVSDAGAARVAGFPAHRVNRFLASFSDRLTTADGFDFWAGELRALDREIRGDEIANLPSDTRRELAGALGIAPDALGDTAESCAESIHRTDLADPARRTALLHAAVVPDHYNDWERFAGLYAVSAIPISMGYQRWRAETTEQFSRGADLQAQTVVDYVPPQSTMLQPSDVAAIVRNARSNPLGIPYPEPQDAARLFATFAPVWRVGTESDDDRIGRPEIGPDGMGRTATDVPTVFTRLSHTWWGGKPLLQLNYGIWFPARTLTGRFDILGGHMDGLWWRVTLGEDGRPLVYDTIHQCGCYHTFFPATPLGIADRYPASDIRERPFAPTTAPSLGNGERMVVSMAPVTHYVVDIGTQPIGSPGTAYAFADDDGLRSLPTPGGGRKSLFGPDGIVAGTERMERFLLWPMGIASPGAMRQWGTHATAFVGRRHFDDPFLLDQALTR
ncbi:MAG: hypothetical protein CMM50_02675 [Rhodospirillaceae bacterium]|nr:hypothetical protein [Rhodospirillaceae bacterium]